MEQQDEPAKALVSRVFFARRIPFPPTNGQNVESGPFEQPRELFPPADRSEAARSEVPGWMVPRRGGRIHIGKRFNECVFRSAGAGTGATCTAGTVNPVSHHACDGTRRGEEFSHGRAVGARTGAD